MSTLFLKNLSERDTLRFSKASARGGPGSQPSSADLHAQQLHESQQVQSPCLRAAGLQLQLPTRSPSASLPRGLLVSYGLLDVRGAGGVSGCTEGGSRFWCTSV